MPKKVRKKHELMNIYLKNYYNGFTKKILEKVEFKVFSIKKQLTH